MSQSLTNSDTGVDFGREIMTEIIVRNHRRFFLAFFSIVVLANIATLAVLFTGSGSSYLSLKDIIIEFVLVSIIAGLTGLLTYSVRSKKYSSYIAVTGIAASLFIFQYVIFGSLELFAAHYIILILSVFYFDVRVSLFSFFIVIVSQVFLFILRPELVPPGPAGSVIGVRFLIYIWVGIGAAVGARATKHLMKLTIENAREVEEKNSELNAARGNFEKTVDVLSEQVTNQDHVINNMHDLSQKQASSLEEISASLEELTGNSDSIAQKAQNMYEEKIKSSNEIDELSRAFDTLRQGSERITELTGDILKYSAETTEQMDLSRKQFRMIEKKGEEMSGFVNVINSIADQVNMLSLNASIEAARAGDYGRGFAVVADEISKLAVETTNNAREIEKLINENMADLRNSGVVFEKTTDATGRLGSSIEAVTGNITEIRDIVTGVGKCVDIITELNERINELSQSISVSTEEQRTATDEASKTVYMLNESAQEIVNIGQNIFEITRTIRELSKELAEFVGKEGGDVISGNE